MTCETRIRRRRDRGTAARGRRGVRHDQRAALHLVERDHGREEEAARTLTSATSALMPTVGEPAPKPRARSWPPPPGREHSSRPPTRARAPSPSSTSSPDTSSCEPWAPRLHRALRRRAAQGSAGSAGQGRRARRRRSRRGAHAVPPLARSRFRPANSGQTVYVADNDALELPLPQPRVDVLPTSSRTRGLDTVLFAGSVLARRSRRRLAARLEGGINWDLVDLRTQRRPRGHATGVQDSVHVDVGWKSTGGPDPGRHH